MINFEEVFLNKVGDDAFKEASPIMLAYIGDAIHTLYVRDKVVKRCNLLIKDYHKKSVALCKASAQANVLDKLKGTLTEDESDIIRRARNAKIGHVAKHSDIETYKKATSYEALIGYLYLKGNFKRLKEILAHEDADENL